MTSKSQVKSSRSAADQRDNAKCAVVTASTGTLRSVKSRELMILVSGQCMTKILADLITTVTGIQRTLLTSVCAA